SEVCLVGLAAVECGLKLGGLCVSLIFPVRERKALADEIGRVGEKDRKSYDRSGKQREYGTVATLLCFKIDEAPALDLFGIGKDQQVARQIDGRDYLGTGGL